MGEFVKEACKTKCIDCGNACGGCSWSRDFTPVDGWFAAPQLVKNHDRQKNLPTFLVMACPEFIPDKRVNPEGIPADSIHALAAAVVEQAIDDYRTCIRGKTLSGESGYRGKSSDPEGTRKKSIEGAMNSIERFFRSDWFYILCDCDGEMIIKRLKEERYLHQVRKARDKMGL
jgi:hypothetical protein